MARQIEQGLDQRLYLLLSQLPCFMDNSIWKSNLIKGKSIYFPRRSLAAFQFLYSKNIYVGDYAFHRSIDLHYLRWGLLNHFVKSNSSCIAAL